MQTTIELPETLHEAAEQIAQVLVDAAPEVYSFTLTVIRWESVGYLVIGIAGALLAWGLFRWARLMFEDDPYNLGSLVAAMGGVGAGATALINLLYIWNWIGAFAPQLRLARQVLGKFL